VKALLNVAASGLVQLATIAAVLFIPAGTFDYWQAWVLLAVFIAAVWIPTLYLQVTNPAAMQRRLRGGARAEGRTVQKVVIIGLYGSLIAMCVTSALDHRNHWSTVPTLLCVAGQALVAAGMVMTILVITQNHYAATTVQVETGQQVISDGLYAHVRHPMYTANTLLLVGLPLALGSYWALVFLIPGLLVLTSRIHDEEKLLVEELPGYRQYTQQVRHRLVPGMW
jgi:protein-S-isoprenylcysteine O-methyltransferase Ste14